MWKNKNKVKIIGGKWKSRLISFPLIRDIRPTPNRVRETLFNWLRNDIIDAHCLDAFAGSGSLGFESLSRGANEVCFIDKERAIVNSIKAQLELFNVNSKTILGDAKKILEHQSPEKFNIIFLDPPYSYKLKPILMTLSKWLTNPGYVYIERKENDMDELIFDYYRNNSNDYELIKSAIYAKVEYGLLRYDKST
ncbi:MAG: 16S rRNA (guanine(966)-N(2))-methyltransferase RsmD [Pseudomonadota bacterium]|nr:16S rRNA (guanine(966)-N(2))-methyltransferase RsmD [Gammaproteobacteria bacterium]MEE2684310.1 16S rRNA (guanine(966)-N(2))-methyltransferase RsmD [Pseudomonadota bacterium]|tara:strand:+ start:3269 stop:3850 length:582 start_codon:yes stop_codon:yes gene_type:complete